MVPSLSLVSLFSLVSLLLGCAQADFANIQRIFRESQRLHRAAGHPFLFSSTDGSNEHDAHIVSDAAPPQYFPSRIDHFDLSAAPNQVYNQRYYVNDTFDTPSGPLFVYIGGEAEIGPSRVSKGFAIELARRHSGRLIAVEHRFYGKSQPFPLPNGDGNGDVSSLRFLSSQQALYDLVELVTNYTASFTPSKPVVAIGGSYPGSLSAWARLKFPHVFVGSLASSAPVEARARFVEYDESISAALGPAVSDNVRAATARIEAVLTGGNQSSIDALKQDFGCPTSTDNISFLYVLADTVAYAVQYGQYNLVTGPFKDSGEIATYAAFVRNIFNTTKLECTQWDMTIATAKTDLAETDNMRQWFYQSCIEFGYFQVAPDQNPLRSKLIDLKYHLDLCAKAYPGIDFTSTFPAIAATNAYYGATRYAGTNTFFSNGGNDPWRMLSVTQNGPNNIITDVIEGGSHCSDLSTPSASDSEALKEDREVTMLWIDYWLEHAYSAITVCGKIPTSGSPSPSPHITPNPSKPPKTFNHNVIIGVGITLFIVAIAITAFVVKKITTARITARPQPLLANQNTDNTA